MSSPLTKNLAERHEALFLQCEALQKSVGLIATRNPASPLPQATRILAETLLFDTRPFLPARQDKLPMAAPDHAGLLTQLGQALAGLLAYQAHWTEWVAAKSCFCWIIRDERLPVRRLHPQVAIVEQKRSNSPRMLHLREKLAERLTRQRQGDYDDGYKAGMAAARAQADLPDAAPERAGPRLLSF